MAKRKRTNNDLQNITHTTKDRATRTTLNIAGVLRKGNHFLLDQWHLYCYVYIKHLLENYILTSTNTKCLKKTILVIANELLTL